MDLIEELEERIKYHEEKITRGIMCRLRLYRIQAYKEAIFLVKKHQEKLWIQERRRRSKLFERTPKRMAYNREYMRNYTKKLKALTLQHKKEKG